MNCQKFVIVTVVGSRDLHEEAVLPFASETRGNVHE